jgi:DNA-binding CsgD family transcriptional regulator
MLGVEQEFHNPLLPPEMQEQVTNLLHKLPIAMVCVDCNGTVTHASGRGLGRLNLSPHDLIGKSIIDLTPDLPHVLDDIHDALTGATFTSVVEVGAYAYEAHYQPQRDASGVVVGVIIGALDVTDQVRLREEVLRLRQRLATLEIGDRRLEIEDSNAPQEQSSGVREGTRRSTSTDTALPIDSNDFADRAEGGEDTLSACELNVLRRVADRMTNAEVAADLGVAASTVKWHLENIYRKLDVPNRRAAVRRAQELGLIA